MTLRELHLFAGIGGGILGGMLLGHRCVGAVEIDPYCRRVLEARQRDGILESFPIHDDIRTFDGTAWRGRVDVVAGGFPCQDISNAGTRNGLDGARSSLWWEMHRVIREVRPRYVFVENVASLLVRGFDRVLGSMAGLGFDAEWCVRSARDVGAQHLRNRLWILAAHPMRGGTPQQQELVTWRGDASDSARHGSEGIVANTDSDGLSRPRLHVRSWRQDEEAADSVGDGAEVANANGGTRRQEARITIAANGGEANREGQTESGRRGDVLRRGWWTTEPRVGRVAHGIPARVDQLRGLGNAQVPAVAAAAFAELIGRFSGGACCRKAATTPAVATANQFDTNCGGTGKRKQP